MNDKKIKVKSDVIVIGGGVNGLIAAAYLAKSGKKTRLFEKKDQVGGTALSEAFFPGHTFSSLVDGSGYISPRVYSDLKLKQHGLEIVASDAIVYSLQPDGNNLLITHDIEETAREIANFSKPDAEAYPKFIERLRLITDVVEELLHITPPDLPDFGIGTLFNFLPMLKPARKIGRKEFGHVMRVMPMPVADLLNEWFESEEVKGAIAASAMLNRSWGPQEAGTGYSFLYNWASSNNGYFRSSGNVLGGMGALANALANAAKALGVEINTNAEVSKIVREEGAATGIELVNGDIYEANIIVSAANMNTTFLKLVDPYYLDQSFVKAVKNIKYRGTTARVHFVLKELPQFNGVNGNAESVLSGHVQISPTMTYLQKAFDPVKYGRYSEEPYLDIHFPTITDPSLSSDASHHMSVTVKYMPYHLREKDWKKVENEIGKLVVKVVSEYAPGFKKLIKQQKIISPLELEQEYDLPEGNYVHGEMTLDQFMWMRPVPGYGQYRSPVKNLYLCGAATHPGGGITGINGRNAAREILRG
jgi:phytoene dehydrogenase-like protein